MQSLLEIWKQICESNLFNFIVMILLFVYICTKCHIGQKIEDGRKKIENVIQDSEQNKESSLAKLYEAQDNSTKTDEEILEILKSAENDARNFGEKILDETKLQKDKIKENNSKKIESNKEAVKNTVMTNTAQKALSLAEEQIKEELKKNPDLHLKFINESIDTINSIGI